MVSRLGSEVSVMRDPMGSLSPLGGGMGHLVSAGTTFLSVPYLTVQGRTLLVSCRSSASSPHIRSSTPAPTHTTVSSSITTWQRSCPSPEPFADGDQNFDTLSRHAAVT